MDKVSYQFLHHQFSPRSAGDYVLLLLGDDGGFSFAVAEGKQMLLLSNPVSWDLLDETAKESNMLSAAYGKKLIALPAVNFSLVPSVLFRADKATALARFLNTGNKEKVFAQQLDKENHILFKVSADIVSRVTGIFDLNDVVFAQSGWITAIGSSTHSNSDIYLQILANKVDILYFQDGKLRFFNTFPFCADDELVYYVTLVLTELEVAEPVLHLGGDAASVDRYLPVLSRFFSNVRAASPPLTVNPSFLSHPVSLLTALVSCESSAAG